MGKYLYWSKKIEIQNYNTVRSKLYIYDGKRKSTHQVNNSARDIVLTFDGTRTYDEACNVLIEKYNDTYENVNDVIQDFLKSIRKFKVTLLESDTPAPYECTVYGEEQYYPEAVSIELTSRCNMRCIHCYGEFGPDVNLDMDLKQVKKLVKELKSLGVMVIELTGGDITVYPNILEVVKYCVKLGFGRVNLLTNGVALKKELMDYAIEHKDVVAFQIDLHSLRDEYYKWFTKLDHVVDKIKSNISYLAKNKILVRVVTIVTKRNLNELNQIVDWVYEQGVFWNSGIVEGFGRASDNIENDMYLNQDEYNQYISMLLKIQERDQKLGWAPPEEDRANEHNCGVLTTHTVIATSGRIKLCTMEYIKGFSLGNVFENTVKEIFDANKEFIKAFAQQETPPVDAVECKDCKYQIMCSSCILQHLMTLRKTNFNCSWVKNGKMNPIILNKVFPEME